MDLLALGVEFGKVAMGALIGAGGAMGVHKRRRNGHGAEHCAHCDETEAAAKRIKDLEDWKGEARIKMHDLANHVQNAQAHARRLEKEADERKAEVTKRLDSMDEKLDAVLERVYQIPTRRAEGT